jgi:hypothetical protein
MGPITDERLDEWERGESVGNRNAAPYLRPLSPEDRAKAVSEARAIQNTTPGYTYAQAVEQAVRNLRSGDLWGGAKADALMRHDPTGEKAARHTGDWDSFVADAMNQTDPNR